jgi:ribosomal protein S18 acetylase RimI-like enzyme
MRIRIRLMQGEDVPQIVAIEQSWDYLSKWGEEGYRGVLSQPRIYACLVAEDLELDMPNENPTAGTGGAVPEKGYAEPSALTTPARRAKRGLIRSQEIVPLQKSLAPVLGGSIIAGFAILALLIDHCALCNLVVRPSYLSKKVGYSLLQQCFEVARQCNIEEVLLEVRQSNHRAIEFYEKNGFRIISLRKNYYRNPPEHAWIMEKRVDRSS